MDASRTREAARHCHCRPLFVFVIIIAAACGDGPGAGVTEVQPTSTQIADAGQDSSPTPASEPAAPTATSTTEAATITPATPSPTTVAAPARIEVVGDDDFVAWTERALRLLELEVPVYYTQVIESIRFIESVEAGSGMDVFNKVYLVGDVTAYAPGFGEDAQLIWYAATIVHDSCHSARYDRGEQHRGKEAEVACLMDQLSALGALNENAGYSSYIQGLIDGADDPENQYWNNPNRHW